MDYQKITDYIKKCIFKRMQYEEKTAFRKLDKFLLRNYYCPNCGFRMKRR